MTKQIAVLATLCAVGWFAGCDTPSNVEECEEAPLGPCDEIVSCCDSILAADPQGASPAGELCLTDQLDALAETEKLNPDNALCEAMALQTPYQETCFSCAADENSAEESSATP